MAVDGIELDAVRRERGQGKNNFPVQPTMNRFGNLTRLMDLPICSPWTFRENHSPNTIYTVNRRNQPTAMDLYFLDWIRTRYKTEPETHTKSAHTVL